MAGLEELRMLLVEPIVGIELSAEGLIFEYQKHRGIDSMDSMSGQFEWYRVVGCNHVLLTVSKHYTPTIHDLGKVLLLHWVGKSLFSTRAVLNQQGRQMVKVVHHNICPNISTGLLFTVVTYNVLADMLATPEKFPKCPPWALKWEHRRPNLLKEISQFDADIICLQEVQQNHYEDCFLPELTKQGYGGLFKKKKRPLYTPTVDGCAIFYRLSQFDFLKCERINFRDFARGFHRFEKDNIGLNVVLKFKNTSQRLCIANTHIHANPNNSDVKLWQVSCMLRNLELLVRENNNAPLVICGDFNSLPGSAAHSLLTQASVNPHCKEILDYDPDGALKVAERFQHKLPLASAYSSYFHCDVDKGDIARKMNADTWEPNFTNFVSDFQGTLDYILYTPTNLKVVSLLDLVDKEEVKEYGALPSPNYSSDHIPLAAKFSYNQLIPSSTYMDNCNPTKEKDRIQWE